MRVPPNGQIPSAVRGIRQVDPHGSIGLIGAELDPPYNRPPLTKALWKGKPIERIWRKMDGQEVELHLGRKVQLLDPQNKHVTDDHGTEYTFDRLLLATGGAPKRLAFGDERIIYYRTVEDYRHLRTLAEHGKTFAVIGGGFIGSEIAAALALNGKQVVMVFPGEGIGAHLFPRDLSLSLNSFYRDKSVEVRPRESVAAVETRGEQLALKFRNMTTSIECRIYCVHE